MDRRTMVCISKRNVFVHEVTSDVEDTSEHLFADRNRDGFTGIGEAHAALETVRGGHGDRAQPAVAEVLLHFQHEVGFNAIDVEANFQRIENGGQVAGFGEVGIDNGADDLNDGSLVAHK